MNRLRRRRKGGGQLLRQLPVLLQHRLEPGHARLIYLNSKGRQEFLIGRMVHLLSILDMRE